MTGQVLGTAGGSVHNGGSWAKNAATAAHGKKGELATAELLAALADNGATVLHDLRIPIPGIKANIDHVVVSGRDVLIIDSKMWAPGFYWTFAGRTRRGVESFPHADKQTMRMAYDAIRRHLAGSRGRVIQPLVVVWASRPGRTQLGFARTPGARLVAAHTAVSRILAATGGLRPADANVVERLRRLLISKR